VFPIRIDRRWLATTLVLAAACGDGSPVVPEQAAADLPARAIQAFDCQADLRAGVVSCGAPAASGASRAIIGGQNEYVVLTSSNVTASSGIFAFNVTVQNLLPEGLGTPDGVLVDPAGIKVLFASGPTVTAGSGNVSVDNEDGNEVLIGTEPQPFFRYDQKLAQDEVSAAKEWRIAYDPGVERFAFTLLVATEVQPLLVINEVMVNPSFQVDSDSEWFEVYNAGGLPVRMEGMLIADSVASGRRAFHRIASPLNVEPGAYVVLGKNSNTTINGGVPVDYAYGAAMSFVNNLGAFKISRTTSVAGDTLTIDRTQYASAAVSAQSGISRELRNPALDNSNMDGSNWADASVTAVYGSGGRGTPRAQNSTYTP